MRLIWGNGGESCDPPYKWASLTLDAGTKHAKNLKIHHLDGAANDGFNVYVGTDLVATYVDQYSSNTWLWSDFDISAGNYTGLLTIKLEATAPSWSGCPTWGQVAVTEAELYGDPFIADLKKVDLQAIGPAEGPVSEQIPFDVIQVLHNNGPAPLVPTLDVKEVDCPDITDDGQPTLTQCSVLITPDIWEISAKDGVPMYIKPDCVPPKIPIGFGYFQGPPSVLGLVPGDCFVVDSVPGVIKELDVKKIIDLPISVPVQDVTTFDVHCMDPSSHTLTIQDHIEAVDGYDPDPNNNAKETTYTIACIGQADVKIDQVVPNPPSEIPVSEDVPITVVKTLHNNGPEQVEVEVGSVLDRVNIGGSPPGACDKAYTAEETAHSASGWGKAVDLGCQGNWGGGSTDDTSRVVWHDPAKERDGVGDASARVTLDSGSGGIGPGVLRMEVLDGIADGLQPPPGTDDFEVRVNGTLVYSYDAKENTAECWVTHTIDLGNPAASSFALAKACGDDLSTASFTPGAAVPTAATYVVEITATGAKWPSFSTYGQLGVSLVELLAGHTTQVVLPVSQPVVIEEQRTIHCFEPSFHDFTIPNEILRIKDAHVIDPDPNNNSTSSQITVACIGQADVKKVSLEVFADDCVSAPPASMKVSEDLDICVKSTIHNNGPFDTFVDDQVNAAAPLNCDVQPAQVGSTAAPLPVSVPLVYQDIFTIHCTEESTHEFNFNDTVAINDIHLVDPDPNNNSKSAALSIDVIADADVKVTGVTVDCDDPVDVNTPFACKVDVSVHNNGPETPVNADVTVGLNVPPDCDDPADQTQQNVSLAASSAVVVSKTFQTQCSSRSFHKFTGSGDVQVDQLHVVDPDSSNNSGSGEDTISVFDLADAKTTSVSINCPANADPNVPFTCTVDVTVHNNGPTTPITVGGAANVGVPDDCTVANYNPNGFGFGALQLAASVNQAPESKDFDITCTANGVHEIVGCGIVQINQEHVRDSVPIANNYGTDQTTTDIEDPAPFLPAGRCTTFDPVEVCGDGIDNDGDTLVDEEPDTDGDGISDCDDPDDDDDSYSDNAEAFMGTDPLAACPATGTANDEDPDAFPPDFDDSQDVSITDILAVKPVFGSTDGDGTYVARNDLDTSGDIGIVDVLGLKPHFGTNCNY